MTPIEEFESLLFGLTSLDSLKPFDQFESNHGRRLQSRAKR
jgi:hypothetical protein